MTSTLPRDSSRLTHFLMTARRGSFESYYLQPESHCSGKAKVGGVQTTVRICVWRESRLPLALYKGITFSLESALRPGDSHLPLDPHHFGQRGQARSSSCWTHCTRNPEWLWLEGWAVPSAKPVPLHQQAGSQPGDPGLSVGTESTWRATSGSQVSKSNTAATLL